MACGSEKDNDDSGEGDNNQVPVISGIPSSAVNEGNPYHFAPMASDSDSGDTLTFFITNKPSWADFNDQTGVLNGTPGLTDAGDYDNIVISVSDGTATAELPAFMISVANINQIPVISGIPANAVNEGSPYQFAPTASDGDSLDTLTFSITNKPSWANFDNQTGVLSGTPGLNDADDYESIVIGVSDGIAIVELSAFTITVVDVSSALVVSMHSPATQATEVPLDSNITITFDASVDALTVTSSSVTLLGENGMAIPTTLNTDNQIITIDPTGNLESLVTYTVIVTTAVSSVDGAMLGGDYSWAFTTTESAMIDPSRVTVNLSWNIDDVVDTDILPSGYLIYYGRQSGSLTGSVDVGMSTSRALNGSEFSFTEVGEYYFHIVAYNADKSLFSAPSTEVMIDIRPY